MQFNVHKRRQTPTVIIISLIDVLLVVLIFLMVTTTFKQQPAVRLALPESRQAKPGATENALVVTIPKQGTMF
jgi:biopolymer transport protein ExbD